jgi:FAD/FMN-containing dehydrogenase
MQGRHGLILDHFVKLNVVLADGTTTTVSEQSNPDLFWAMRGAGHNFGIVTSFEHKVFPRDGDLWYSKIYTFNSTKLEAFHTALNELKKKQIAEIINWSIYLVDPTVSTTEPVIHWAFEYIGGNAQLAKPYLAPFEALNPINVVEKMLPYPEIPVAEGTHAEGPLCEKGDQRMQMNAGLKEYNVTAQRQVFELFKKNIFHDPAILGSVIVMEGYSTQAVAKVDPASTAYALRDDDLLVYVSQPTISNFVPTSTNTPQQCLHHPLPP